MAFWSSSFLAKRREHWLASLVKFQYQVGGSWYDATINSKKVNGSQLEIVANCPPIGSGTETITGVRIIDVGGNVAGSQTISTKRTATQGVVNKFVFPIVETK